MKTQCQRLLQELKRRPLTKLQILRDLGILNGGGRIGELREDGHDIKTNWLHLKSRSGPTKVAQYVLVKERKK